MSPSLRRLSDIAMLALTGTCLGVLAISPGDSVARVVCSATSICSQDFLWLEPVALAILTCIILYVALVRCPLHRKQWWLRNRLTLQYCHFKKTCIAELLLITDGLSDLDSVGPLLEPHNFRNYFAKEGSSRQTRWYAFQHNLDQASIEQISSSMKMLHAEISLVLDSIDVRYFALFEFRKRLAVTMDVMSAEVQLSEKAETLANFLWSAFAGRDAVYDIEQEDLLKKALDAIDRDAPLPFTRQWWRRAERREPLSAYDTLWWHH